MKNNELEKIYRKDYNYDTKAGDNLSQLMMLLHEVGILNPSIWADLILSTGLKLDIDEMDPNDRFFFVLLHLFNNVIEKGINTLEYMAVTKTEDEMTEECENLILRHRLFETFENVVTGSKNRDIVMQFLLVALVSGVINNNDWTFITKQYEDVIDRTVSYYKEHHAATEKGLLVCNATRYPKKYWTMCNEKEMRDVLFLMLLIAYGVNYWNGHYLK